MKLKIGKYNVLVVSDLQEPFGHKDALDFVIAVSEKYDTNETVVIGDEADLHAFSGKFPHDPDGFSPGEELEAARKGLKPWYEVFPEAKVCTSNHVERYYKKAYNAGFPRAALVSEREL